ncbi:hypothetical protein LTR66_004428 [Elasticomyces elasticus]|nr:hypothetical protein LTR66_004428 [Elasticomyces elasticus]
MADGRPAGVFLGHTEGVTYIDSKGDGRFIISNGKDQTMKLWDLRRMIPPDKAEQIEPLQYTLNFDYRVNTYDKSDYRPHPHDCSLVTFHGHRVLKTLIRCHFSPPNSSDQRYVYTGSQDGGVYIYNLDGTLARKIDVHAATKGTRSREDEGLVDSDKLERLGSRLGYLHRAFVERWAGAGGRGSWRKSEELSAAKFHAKIDANLWKVNDRLEYDASYYNTPDNANQRPERTGPRQTRLRTHGGLAALFGGGRQGDA